MENILLILVSWINGGGHSGRADDYHYHLAPEHLEKVVGEGNPIAYALDGFPLYGKIEAPLDEYLGRFNQGGSYQYHAVDYPPYFIAGLRGKVQVDSDSNAPEDQIMPQPRTQPVRTDNYGPLKGATITGLKKIGERHYSLEYTIHGKQRRMDYSWNKDYQYQFVFVDENDHQIVEHYQKNNKRLMAPTGKKAERTRKATSRNHQPRKYCGDGICDNTESNQQCPADC